MAARSEALAGAAPSRPSTTTQAITVVQPSEPQPLMLNVTSVSLWLAAVIAFATVVGIAYQIFKWLTKDIVRDIAELRHKIGNASSRVDALEHLRIDDVARIVKVETMLSGIERGQDRIEKTLADRFDTLAESIREIRTVAPRL